MSEAAAARRSYDALAARYLAEIGDELASRPLERGLLDTLAELSAPGVVADVGSGPGHIAAYLAARGARVIATDLSAGMCDLAKAAGVPAAAGELTALPLRTGSLSGLISFFAVIHLADQARRVAYREFARVLRPGGHALVGFHVSSADVGSGGTHRPDVLWGIPVELTFRYLRPDDEIAALDAAGLVLTARIEREPVSGEHASRRCYLLVTRS